MASPEVTSSGPLRNSSARTMKAAVIRHPGGPDVLEIEECPIPVPSNGEVLIAVKAFGLNRSELFTRQGISLSVRFPRILGIEAVGLVVQAPGREFQEGDIVATAMGGMGRQFDGGYAEYTCVPASQVQVLKTSLRNCMARASPRPLAGRSASSCCVRAASTRCSSTPGPSLRRSRRSFRAVSTRYLS